MKLILKDGNVEHELTEMQGISADAEMLFIRLNARYKPDDIAEMTRELTKAIGKKVVLLDPRFGEVIMVK